MTVYADNAATTRLSDKAFNAMQPLLKEVYGNPSSLHSLGQQAKTLLEQSREKIALSIGASPKEIYFTSGGSEADNQAIRTAAYIGKAKGKNHIISSAFEHHAVLHTLDALKKEGFEITLIKPDRNGLINEKDIEAAVKDETCLVTIMMANNEIGTIQPVEKIAEICKEKKVLFHTDAVQAIGHIPVDVEKIGCDMLSASGHKFHGPKGTGFLYVKKGIILKNLIEGGAQERGKRAGTENLPAIVGMAEAIEEAVSNLESNMSRVTSLRNRLIDGLSGIERSFLNGDRKKRLPGNVNMCFEGIEGESLLLLLDRKGICASSGSACTSGSLDPSHVLLSIGVPVEIAHGSLRLSLSEYNTEEEIEHIIESVPQVVDYLRSISPVWEKIKKEEK
ncbi:MAG: cysteine desulfurase NifS [Ruminococcaceae bacterium]|nr:cysteine desulfurase NifS [Oscillospiraceae bacterium]